ncbi:hypothetical protein KIPB_013220, partial [Kipferlia bialata]
AIDLSSNPFTQAEFTTLTRYIPSVTCTCSLAKGVKTPRDKPQQ